MYGQKEIFSCLAIVLLVSILNFYKSIMKRDREMEQYRLANIQNRLMEEAATELQKQVNEANIRKTIRIAQMLEYNDTCFAIHALIFKQFAYDDDATDKTMTGNGDDDNKIRNQHERDVLNGAAVRLNDASINNDDEKIIKNCGDISSSSVTIEKQQPSISSNIDRVSKTNGKIMDKISESSSSIVYVFVLILFVSLVKALFDLSKQFKEVSVFGWGLLF